MSGDVLEKMANNLICEGWPITAKQLNDFIGESISRIQDVNQLRKQLLDADMREYALPLLSDRISKQLGEFKGPLVVQITRQRNISYPKYNEAKHTDGLIKIQLSDGFSSIQALLFESLPKLNIETPPGTKICLAGKIPVENGILLINETNCKVLGGSVKKMVEKWNMEKDWQQNSIRTTESNAPKWIPFSKQQLRQPFLPDNAINKVFRANDVINGLCKKMTDEHADDFSAARKAQIEQVVENNAIKKFAPIQLKPKLPANSSSISCNNVGKKDPLIKGRTDEEDINRRFVRDKKNLSPIHRPSNPPTLFDFLQSKVPVSGNSPGYHDYRNLEVEKIEANTQNAEIQGMDRQRKTRVNEKGFRSRQNPNNSAGSRTFEILNSNRYRKQSNWRSEREQNRATTVMRNGFRSNAVDDEFRSNCTDEKSLSAANKELSTLHISSANKKSAVISKNHNIPRQIGNKNHDYQQNTVYRPMYHQQERQQEQSFNNVSINEKMPSTWKIGDKCLAPWSDGQFYPSMLISLGPADMCTVEYDEYGNRSSVPVGVLLPLQT